MKVIYCDRSFFLKGIRPTRYPYEKKMHIDLTLNKTHTFTHTQHILEHWV